MESTLSMPRKELEAEVGIFAGWGRGTLYGETAWSDKKQSAITSCVKSGIRRVYFPPPAGGVSYDWSFLKPTATLTLASGGSVLQLPDDFGGLEGQITITTSDQGHWPLQLVGEGKVRQAFSMQQDASGRPEMAAIRPKKILGPNDAQRQELYIYPEADQAYTLGFQYYLLPNYPTGDESHVYGGMAHAETFKAACKAAFERDFNDVHEGPQELYFRERLAASINHDRRNKPQHFGYNGDRSDEMGNWRRPRPWMDQLVTIGGVEP